MDGFTHLRLVVPCLDIPLFDVLVCTPAAQCFQASFLIFGLAGISAFHDLFCWLRDNR